MDLKEEQKLTKKVVELNKELSKVNKSIQMLEKNIKKEQHNIQKCDDYKMQLNGAIKKRKNIKKELDLVEEQLFGKSTSEDACFKKDEERVRIEKDIKKAEWLELAKIAHEEIIRKKIAHKEQMRQEQLCQEQILQEQYLVKKEKDRQEFLSKKKQYTSKWEEFSLKERKINRLYQEQAHQLQQVLPQQVLPQQVLPQQVLPDFSLDYLMQILMQTTTMH